MPAIMAAHVTYEREEEHILRRLGGAIVVQWRDLPKTVRERLVEQACYMHDRHQTVQLNEQIQAFIERHQKGGSDRA